MPELDGKVAIVTGAGRLRGIGRGAAVAFARLGADVVVTGTGRNPDRYPPDEKAVSWRDIESTAEQVRAEGTRALPLIVDVADATSVQQMVERTIAEFGRIDILVNNAAYARGPDRVPITELQQDIFQRVLDVKITGTYLCTKAVIEPMIAQGGGKIVTHLVRLRQDRQRQQPRLHRRLLRASRHDPVHGGRTRPAQHQRQLYMPRRSRYLTR